MAAAEKSSSYIPISSGASDGWSNDDEATATCFCGAVQLAFPTHGPGLLYTVVCNCADCHKISGSMFASIFGVADTHLKHLRGRENLKTYSQAHTITSGNTLTNHFCTTCGTLMYRIVEAKPGAYLLRIGTVDDFRLHETKLKPQVELYTKDRVSWCRGLEGARQYEAMPPTKQDKAAAT